MSTKTTKKKKVKKVVAKKPVSVKPVKVSSTIYRVDMKCTDTDRSSGVTKEWFVEYYPGRAGTSDEPMARSMMEYLKGIGQAGRLVEVDETPDGKILEEWEGISQVTQAVAEESKQPA